MTPAQRRTTLRAIEAEIPRLRRFARFLVRDVEYADDLVQECLLRAIDKLESWRPGTNLRAWLFVIQRNVFRNDLRKNGREIPLDYDLESSPAVAVPAAQEARMALLEVREAFQRLSYEHREVLLLVAIEGLTYEEASTILDIPVGTVRSRLSRARSALRDMLESEPVPTNRMAEKGGRNEP